MLDVAKYIQKQIRKQIIKISLDIPAAKTTKFTDVIVDQNLNWQSHIEHLYKKLTSAQYVIRRIRTLTNEEWHTILPFLG